MSATPASELVSAGLRDAIETWIIAEFGDGRVVTRGAQTDLYTLLPEQTPAIQIWETPRKFVDTSENVPNTVSHGFTIRGITRVTSADDPKLTELLANRLIDVLDQLWVTTVLGNVGCTITQEGDASVTWDGSDHALVNLNVSIRYERMAQP